MKDPAYEAEVLTVVWYGWDATLLPTGRALVAVALQRVDDERVGLAIQWTERASGVEQTMRFPLPGDEPPVARAQAVLATIRDRPSPPAGDPS